MKWITEKPWEKKLVKLSWFFEKINKIKKHLLVQLAKKERKDSNKIKNDIGDASKIKRIPQDYYEQLMCQTNWMT